MTKIRTSRLALFGLICAVIGAVGLLVITVFLSRFRYADPVGAAAPVLTGPKRIVMPMLANIDALHLGLPIFLFVLLLIIGVVLLIYGRKHLKGA